MAKDSSFDIVSKVDMQEVRNGMQQAQKEIATRFDFRGTSASVPSRASRSSLLRHSALRQRLMTRLASVSTNNASASAGSD